MRSICERLPGFRAGPAPGLLAAVTALAVWLPAPEATAGSAHRANRVEAWGRNGFGHLGDGTTTERHPVAGAGLTEAGVRVISAGRNDLHSLALLRNGTVATGSSSPSPQTLPYDIRPLLKPCHKYLGVVADGAPDSMKPVTDFATMVGKRPNMVEFYSYWGDAFDLNGVDNVWQQGALPYWAWEPMTVPINWITEGRYDGYIRSVATTIRTANIPIAISFGHEMNGVWTPWGISHFSPADFVKAWRHIHDVFQQVGATMVIWVWSPSQTSIAWPPLEPFWPGDRYVDWIGVIGYYGQAGRYSFKALFDPTLNEVRAFTKKPVILAETAAPSGHDKPAEIADLFSSVASRSDVIGLVWFNINKPGYWERDWRVNSSPEAKAAFRRFAAHLMFDFDVRKPQCAPFP